MTQGGTKQQFNPLSDKENQLAREAIDIAFRLHKALGPGLLENVYTKCFCYELEKEKYSLL